ncbi:Hypothetical predicted protein [Pelobates cultripes]|uniref:Uncharacterized protein n=1 Tax=Pelobates cultripes TaxID=61616 RepID=A0AAD1WHR4_PELCU|nr:Hypothetical predicted protein [Pelobates cultripes]
MALNRNIDSIRQDRKSFMDTWSLKKDEIPCTQSTRSPQKQCDSVKTLIYKLGKTMEKEVHVWWDIATLDFYVNNNIVPRGLRLYKRLAYKRNEPTLLKKWDQLLDKGSLLLMVFLINEKKKDLTQLDQEIKDLKTSIRPLVESGEYVELLEKMEKRVKDIEMNIREIKKKKIVRDQTDYKTLTQRNWKKDQRPRHYSPAKPRTDHSPQRYLSYRDALVSHKTPLRDFGREVTHTRHPHNTRYEVPYTRYYSNYHSKHYRKKTQHQNYYRNSEYRQPENRSQERRQQTQFLTTNKKSPEHSNPQTSTTGALTTESRRFSPQNKDSRSSIVNIANDFLEVRGRVPPKLFSEEDFRSPVVRRKRTIENREGEVDQHEEQILFKRRK